MKNKTKVFQLEILKKKETIFLMVPGNIFGKYIRNNREKNTDSLVLIFYIHLTITQLSCHLPGGRQAAFRQRSPRLSQKANPGFVQKISHRTLDEKFCKTHPNL